VLQETAFYQVVLVSWWKVGALCNARLGVDYCACEPVRQLAGSMDSVGCRVGVRHGEVAAVIQARGEVPRSGDIIARDGDGEDAQLSRVQPGEDGVGDLFGSVGGQHSRKVGSGGGRRTYAGWRAVEVRG
jgi:hypothetical protein